MNYVVSNPRYGVNRQSYTEGMTRPTVDILLSRE